MENGLLIEYTEGVRCGNFFSHNVGSPTRVSIMSGQNSGRYHDREVSVQHWPYG
jgi:hypothetical protein